MTQVPTDTPVSVDNQSPLANLMRALGDRVEDLLTSGKWGLDEKRAGLARARHDSALMAECLSGLQRVVEAEAGLIQPVSVTTDMHRVLQDLVQRLIPAARARNVRLVYTPHPLSSLQADREGVAQLLGALTSLLILAMPETAELAVNAAEEEDANLASVVYRWSAAANATKDSQLSLLEWEQTFELFAPLLDVYGGTWRQESLKGGGVRFEVCFPMGTSGSAQGGGTILIVDDDPDGAYLLEQVLVRAGHQVMIAPNGLEGLGMAHQRGIALILLDVMLPGMDGFEVCHRLREDPKTASIPIVMISAKSRDEDRDMGLRVGANAYMTKPLGLTEVVDTVGRLLSPSEEGSHDG